LFSMALLSAPAIWNRFPLLQYDTGGYLARWYEPYLVPSRAVAYGLILKPAHPCHSGRWCSGRAHSRCGSSR
jgi:hypothetical protein